MRFSLEVPDIGNFSGCGEAKYLYVKGGIPFVADSKYDEVAVECLEPQSIDSLLAALK